MTRKKITSWGPGGYHAIFSKRAKVWITTTVVLAIVAVFIMATVIFDYQSRYNSQLAYNTSQAAGALTQRFTNRISLKQLLVNLLSPAISTPATGGNGSGLGTPTNSNDTSGTDSGGDISSSALPHDQQAQSQQPLNNPSIFLRQNQGPSAPWLPYFGGTYGAEQIFIVAQNALHQTTISLDYPMGKDVADAQAQYDVQRQRVAQEQDASLPQFRGPGVVYHVDWGDGKPQEVGFNWSGGETSIVPATGVTPPQRGGTAASATNNKSHVYAQVGVYTIKTKACYTFMNGGTALVAPDPSVTIRPANIARDFPGSDPAWEGRCSPQSQFSIRVVKPEDAGIPVGPDLVLQLDANQPNVTTIDAQHIKYNKVYRPHPDIPLGNYTLVNVGTAPIAVRNMWYHVDMNLFSRAAGTMYQNFIATRLVLSGGQKFEAPAMPALRNHPALISLPSPMQLAAGARASFNFLGDALVLKFPCDPLHPRDDDTPNYPAVYAVNQDSYNTEANDTRVVKYRQVVANTVTIDNCSNTAGAE